MRPFTLRDAALDLFFPRRRCMACGNPEGVREGLCVKCEARLTRVPDRVCERCGDVVQAPGLCPRCLAAPPPYAAARAALLYEGPARTLVLAMKFRGEFDLPIRRFSRTMAQRLAQEGWHVDAVVNVPASPKTLHARGYNQAELLARRFAKEAGLPFLRGALRKRSRVRSQVGLGAAERRSNVQGTIRIGRGIAHAAGKTLLLVDDVMTTGATVEECARVLLAAGAQAVYVLCAARQIYADDEELRREAPGAQDAVPAAAD